MGAPRKLALVLHTHLPWVLHHGAWPHGEDWLWEATTHCYLPLLRTLSELGAKGMRGLATITISPVLAAQWRHPSFPEKLSAYLEARIKAAKEAQDLPLARFWCEYFLKQVDTFESVARDLVSAFGQLESSGVVELGTCAATHAYLPLVHDLRSARLSLLLASAFHQRTFQHKPSGVWLPECAYRPGGPFRHPVTGSSESFRPGVEVLLQEAGFRWTVLDTHLATGARPAPSSSGGPWEDLPVASPSLYRPAFMGQSTVAAFFRDPHTSLQVWSRDHGYPGEERYLDFHKRHWPSGLKLWRVTHPQADLAHKAPYDPKAIGEAVDAHAHHFLETVATLPYGDNGVVVAPFDTELFGHWWFEGVEFLRTLFEKAATHPLVQPSTLSQALAKMPPASHLSLPEGSWGEGGDHRVWVNAHTESLWYELEKLERETWQQLAKRQGRDGFRSAQAQELLLTLASDWPFLVTTQAARDYAERRFACHAQRLKTLLDPSLEKLPPWVLEDAVFPDGLLLAAIDEVLGLPLGQYH